MKAFEIFMIIILIIASISVSLVKNLMGSIIIFMVYSLIMAVLWQQLNAPDLAITEAAVGAGVTTLLFILTLRKIRGENN